MIRINEQFNLDFCSLKVGAKMSFEIIETVPFLPLLNL